MIFEIIEAMTYDIGIFTNKSFHHEAGDKIYPTRKAEDLSNTFVLDISFKENKARITPPYYSYLYSCNTMV